jgi:hypothetical protein
MHKIVYATTPSKTNHVRAYKPGVVTLINTDEGCILDRNNSVQSSQKDGTSDCRDYPTSPDAAQTRQSTCSELSPPQAIPRLIRGAPASPSGLTPRMRPLRLVAYPLLLAGAFRG